VNVPLVASITSTEACHGAERFAGLADGERGVQLVAALR
jgi:hypothetical protein